MLIDSHCHIHDKDYPHNLGDVIERAKAAGVEKMICIGTDMESSRLAVKASLGNPDLYATIGVHPHESKFGIDFLEELIKTDNKKIVAIGEIGLDYFYDHSPRNIQASALEKQIQLAVENNLPVSFHVREAYDDFWPIVDNFKGCGLRAVLHSFTDTKENLNKALSRGFYIGINGFCTFIKDETIRQTLESIELDRMMLETDAPYLTPKPFRGTINEPAYIKDIAEFIASTRNISLETVADITSKNVCDLFRI